MIRPPFPTAQPAFGAVNVEQFAQSLFEGLKKRDLLGENAAVTGYDTPRRLAAHVSGVNAESPAKSFEAKMMPAAKIFMSTFSIFHFG